MSDSLRRTELGTVGGSKATDGMVICKMPVRVLALLAFIALLMVSPFAVWGYPQTGDIGFYASSWLEMAHQWRHGIIWPQWASMANFGWGDPRLAFYPPLSQVLGGVVCSLLPAKLAIGVYTWAILLLAGVCCYRFAVSIGHSRVAPLAAAIYVANPYFMLDAHRRMAVPELLGCALLPLVFAASFELAEKGKSGCLKLASIEALLWLTNIPVAIIASLACGIILLTEACRRRSLRCVGYLAAAAGLAVALDAFYLIPILTQLHWIQSSALFGLRPEDHYLFRWSTEATAVDIGAWEVGGVEALILLFVALRQRRLHGARQWVDRTLLLVAGIAFVMMLPVSQPIWRWVPEIRYIQFPWRWLMIPSVVFSVVVPSYMGMSEARIKRYGGIAVALALVAGLAIPLQGYVRGLRFDVMAWQKSADAAGVAGYPEYLPKGASLIDSPHEGIPLVRSAESTRIEDLSVGKWSDSRRSFDVVLSQPDWVTLHVFTFPRWHAYRNGVGTELRSSPGGEAMVYAPAGRSHFDLKFEFTVQFWIGVFISLLALTGVVLARFLLPADDSKGLLPLARKGFEEEGEVVQYDQN